MLDSLGIYDQELPSQEVLDNLMNKTKGLLFTMKGAGFLGSLLCDTEIVWDNSCPTAWTNGFKIGWNPHFFYWLTPKERVTVLAHELWHIACDHMGRLGKTRCPDYWNQAADFFINLMLKDHGYLFGDKLMSVGPCLDPQYRDMSTEQIYDLIAINPMGMPMPQPQAGPPGAQGAPQDGSGHSGGSSIGEPGQDPSQPLHGDLRKSPGHDTGEAKAKITSKIIKAVQASKRAKEAGIVPGEIELLIEEFLNPILPWEVLLQRFFTELSNDDYSWRRPSRRCDEEYLPSLMGENGLEHLIYYLDVSGSVTDADVIRFNSEVKFIHSQLQPKLLTLITFDTKLRDEWVFTDDMPFEKIQIVGRGGTCLTEVQAHIKKHKPSAAVIFSDLYVHPMDADPGVPILWVCIGNDRAQVPFGKLIHIPSEA